MCELINVNLRADPDNKTVNPDKLMEVKLLNLDPETALSVDWQICCLGVAKVVVRSSSVSEVELMNEKLK